MTGHFFTFPAQQQTNLPLKQNHSRSAPSGPLFHSVPTSPYISQGYHTFLVLRINFRHRQSFVHQTDHGSKIADISGMFCGKYAGLCQTWAPVDGRRNCRSDGGGGKPTQRPPSAGDEWLRSSERSSSGTALAGTGAGPSHELAAPTTG